MRHFKHKTLFKNSSMQSL